jgi:hypothetical protein
MFFSSKSASSFTSWSNRLILAVFALLLVFIRSRVDGLFGKKEISNLI